MAGTLQRADNYQDRKKKKEEQSPSPNPVTPTNGNVESPTSGVDTGQTVESANQSVIRETAPDIVSPIQEGMDAGLQASKVLPENPIGESYIDWRKLDWNDAVKANPNLSLSKYISGTAAYRRENGMEDYTDAELTSLLKGRDPYETEAERQQREKRLRRAAIINGVGSFLGNLVNYVRARNGNVAMNLSDGTEGYNRLERIRQGQQQLARANAQDYLGAITRERAERAKEEQQKILREQQKKAMEMDMMRLQIAIDNAKSDAERRKFEQDLATKKFEYQQQLDKEKLAEQRRHNQAQESISRERETGSEAGTSAMNSNGRMMTRKNPLSREVAQQIAKMNPNYLKNLDRYRKRTTRTDEYGEEKTVLGDVDWFDAASDVLRSGAISAETLESMGFRAKKENRRTIEGFSSGQKDDIRPESFL